MSNFTSITHFGIEQEEVTAIADTWHQQHVVVHSIAFDTLGATTGPASSVVAALRAVQQPAQNAARSIGARLGDLSARLRAFNVEATATDHGAAGGLLQLQER